MDERDHINAGSAPMGAQEPQAEKPKSHGEKIAPEQNPTPTDTKVRGAVFSTPKKDHDLEEEEDGLTAYDFESRYIWDEYKKVLYETLPEKGHRRLGFGRWLALGACILILAFAIMSWLLGGKLLLPTGGQTHSILSAEQAVENKQPETAPEETENAVETVAAQEANYVATAILVDGEVEGVLASQEAAYALIDDVKEHFRAMAQEKGEGELTVELMDEVSFRPAETGEEVESYEALIARFTGNHGPLKVKCTLLQKESQEIGFDTTEEDDKYLVEGTSIVVSDGRPGAKVTITHTVYINGEKSTSRSGSESQTIKAQNRVVRVGTQAVESDAETGKKEGKKGPETDLAFQSPMAEFQVAANFGQSRGILHLGLDYKPKEGGSLDVLASCGGTVAAVMKRGGYGLMVEIDHGEGFTTRYAHLESAAVALGDQVLAGQVIGRAGQSGNAETVHLHFELRIHGEAYNPRYYLS